VATNVNNDWVDVDPWEDLPTGVPDLPTEARMNVADPQDVGYLGSPDDRTGFVGGMIERPAEKIPFSPVAAVKLLKVGESAKRLKEFDYAADEEGIARKYPKALPSARKRLLEKATQLKDQDVKIIEDYLREIGKEYSFGGRVGQLVSAMPAFMIEFLATGGIKQLSTEGAKRIGVKILKERSKTIAGRAVIATGGELFGTAVRASGMPNRAAEAILKRRVPKNIKVKDDGSIEYDEVTEPLFTSIAKGLGDHYIEILSEQAGEYGSQLLTKLPFMGKFVGDLQTKWLKLHPNKTAFDFINKISTKVGYNGVIGEIGEEYLGDSLRATFDVDDFGAGEDADMIQRLGAAVKSDTENLPVMATAFAIPGMTRAAAGALAGRAKVQPVIEEAAVQEQQQQVNVYKTVSGSRTGITEQEVIREGDRYIDPVTGEDIILDVEASGTGVVKKARAEVPKKEMAMDVTTESPMFDTARQKAMNQLMNEGVSAEDAEMMTSEGATEGRATKDITETKEMRDRLSSIEKATTINESDPVHIKEQDKLDEPEFGKPGIFSLLTSKRILMQRIGADKLTKKLMTAKERMLVLQKSLNKEVNKVIRSLSKQATLGDKIASRIMKRQTKPVRRMVDLLDTYERLPGPIAEGLTDTEVESFNKLRDITKWLLERTNVARRQAGLETINDLKGYIPHWTNALADDILNGTYPYKSGYLARLMKGVPKTIKNRTAYRRKLMQKIQDHMEQDLGRLMKGLIKYDLTDMLITNPLAQTWEELRQLQTDGKIPDSTADAITKYINYDILEKQAELDRMFNDSLVVRTTTDLINKVLRPMNREISNPAAYYFGGMRKLMHAAFMPFRLRPVTRNLGQRLLCLTFFRGRDLLRAQFGRQDVIIHPETGKEVKVLGYIREQDWYKLSKPEDVLDDETLITILTKSGMIGFKTAHVGNRYMSNVEVSALTAYYDWKYRYNESHNKNSRYYKQIVEHSKKTGIPIEQLQTQKEDMMNDIRDGVQMTQWEYMAHNMPTIFRGQTARGIAAYQSWWMNYFASHGAEALNRIYTGRTRIRGDGTGGRLLTKGARYRSVKGMGAIYGMARLAKQTLGIAMLGALFLPDPTDGLPPILNLFSIMSQLVLGFDRPEKRKQAWRDLKKFAGRLLPFNNAIRDVAKVGNDWTLKDYVFYTDNDEWKQIWVKIEPKKEPVPKRNVQRSVPRRAPVRR